MNICIEAVFFNFWMILCLSGATYCNNFVKDLFIYFCLILDRHSFVATLTIHY